MTATEETSALFDVEFHVTDPAHSCVIVTTASLSLDKLMQVQALLEPEPDPEKDYDA